jgi:hypothetical protein
VLRGWRDPPPHARRATTLPTSWSHRRCRSSPRPSTATW